MGVMKAPLIAVLCAFLVFQTKEMKRMIWLIYSMFFLGIILAGYESYLFPWLNIAGIVIVGLVGLVARKEVL
jgi:hypothetical protein